MKGINLFDKTNYNPSSKIFEAFMEIERTERDTVLRKCGIVCKIGL